MVWTSLSLLIGRSTRNSSYRQLSKTIGSGCRTVQSRLCAQWFIALRWVIVLLAPLLIASMVAATCATLLQWALLCSVGEVVKNGDAVSFGPDADFAGFGKTVIPCFNDLFSVETDGKFVPLKVYA